MIIDFEQVQEQLLANFKGGEKEAAMRMFVDDLNRIMRGKLVRGASIGMHTHDTSSEIIYVISGQGHVIYDGEKLAIQAGQCHYCPKGHTHSLVNDSNEDLIFLGVVPQQ